MHIFLVAIALLTLGLLHQALNSFLNHETALRGDKHLLVTENDNELGTENPWPINAVLIACHLMVEMSLAR